MKELLKIPVRLLVASSLRRTDGEELDLVDPEFTMIIGARAVKTA